MRITEESKQNQHTKQTPPPPPQKNTHHNAWGLSTLLDISADENQLQTIVVCEN